MAWRWYRRTGIGGSAVIASGLGDRHGRRARPDCHPLKVGVARGAD
jgi:hypothetical protein